jgi:hypothetical protein
MKKLVLVCLTILTTISLMTSCGEKTATENATSNASKNATEVVDSTSNATEEVKDSTITKY